MATVRSALGKIINFDKLRIQQAAIGQKAQTTAPTVIEPFDFGGITPELLGMSKPGIVPVAPATENELPIPAPTVKPKLNKGTGV